MEWDKGWIDGYHTAIQNKEVTAIVYGVDLIALEALVADNLIIEGGFDAEKFATGNYVIAGTVDTDEKREIMSTYNVGDSVTIGGKDYIVMMQVKPCSPIEEGNLNASFFLDFYMPADEFLVNRPNNTIRKYLFNIEDKNISQAETILTHYQKNIDSTMPFSSRQKIVERYYEETRASSILGNAISIIIAMVGVLNFINSMVTAIVSRKKEFAMVQSVGMTKPQLRKMLIFEGLDYAGLTLGISFIISTLAVRIGIRAIVEGGYSTFRFTLFPLIVCTPIILAFSILIPYLCFKNLEKQSIVERLRNE